MHYVKSCIFLVSTLLITGCAGFKEANQKVAEWAGKIIEIRDGRSQEQHHSGAYQGNAEQAEEDYYQKTVSAKGNVDAVFVKLKRKFNLKTREAVPNVYYHLEGLDSVPNHIAKYYTVSIKLDNSGKNTTVRWKIYGTKEYARNMERNILSAIK
ncbi:hypothetical protein ACFGWM_03615 [Pasteurella multocida]